jgi:nitrous oxide reductase accessory protein NosL
MMKKFIHMIFPVLLVFGWSFPVIAETVSCAQCGMNVDLNSKYAAKIVQREKTSYFCDIGDLFVYLHEKRVQASGAMAKDYDSGNWIDATQAFYVHSVKKFSTPMGWGVAAFRGKNRAAEFGEAMNFDDAIKIVK